MAQKRKREACLSTASSSPFAFHSPEPSSKRMSEVIATHYNHLEEEGSGATKESRTYHMRNFNNWIKSMVIGEFLDRIKKEKGIDSEINVLDIGCGEGGDLRKYKLGRINHLVCCDIAETSLSQAKDRYQEMVSFDQKMNHYNNSYNRQPQRKSLFSADFIHADCTRERLKDKYTTDSPRFDLVSIQFSFHYCFESLSQAECMIRNAAESLASGGYVIGTTPDAYDIIRRVRDSESLSFGNDVYSISFSKSVINRKPVPLFGAEYKFHLDGVVDCPEFLVYFPAFEKIAAKYGLKLVFKKRFEDYYHEMKGTRDGSNLLKELSAFESFPGFVENSKSKEDEEDGYSHAKDFLDELKGKGRTRGRSCGQVGTLSASEWEAISLNVLFAFVKMDTHLKDQQCVAPRGAQPTRSSLQPTLLQEAKPIVQKKKFFTKSSDDRKSNLRLNVTSFFGQKTDQRLSIKSTQMAARSAANKAKVPIKVQTAKEKPTTNVKNLPVKAKAREAQSLPCIVKPLQESKSVPEPRPPPRTYFRNKKCEEKTFSLNIKVGALLQSEDFEESTAVESSQSTQGTAFSSTSDEKASESSRDSLDLDDGLNNGKQVSSMPGAVSPVLTPNPSQLIGQDVEDKQETDSCVEMETIPDTHQPEFINSSESLSEECKPAPSPLSSPAFVPQLEAETEPELNPLTKPQLKHEPAPVPVPAVEPKPLLQKKKFFNKSSDNKKPHQVNVKTFFKMDFDETVVEAVPSSQEAGSQSSSEGKPSGSGNGFAFEADDGYVKIQRVKKAHQCHDLGETEAFDGDIKFFLDGLGRSNPVGMRCLSILGLSTQCMRAEFRMHLRAHDDMPKIISALRDAPSDPSLALCTSALMFVYNQDRLTMDIDPNALSLMLDLLETRDSSDLLAPGSHVEKRHLAKVKELCETMKLRQFGKFLNVNKLSAGKLAQEALLGLTSKRAGDWVKDEIRRLKGIDFLMNNIIAICANDENYLIEGELNKVDRTLRVLENVTFMNEKNQLYVIDFEEGSLIKCCLRLIKSCKDSMILSSDSTVYLSTLLSVLRVLTNLTSESIEGSKLIGTRFEGVFNLFLDCLFELPSFIIPDSRFDLMVLLLCLSINLVEFCRPIRAELVSSLSKVKRLVEILFDRIEGAQQTEQQADDLLESNENKQMTDVMMDLLLNQVVLKSGKHMEHSIVAACVSLLLGCAVQDDEEAKEMITQQLPDGSFEPLIDVLRKLHEFAHLADIMTPSGVKRVERILQVFKTCSKKHLQEKEEEVEEKAPSSPSLMSLSSTFMKYDDSSDVL